ncbi:MAG: DNA translocase FtsK 4TM domain-containing protein [Chlamydiota bacterium]
MKNSSKKKQVKQHTEMRGLILLFFSGFWGLSLLSYAGGSPSANLLGYLGHVTALVSLYLFGLSSYIFLAILGYAAYLYVINAVDKGIPYGKKTVVCFTVLMFSTSFLATILADTFPKKAPLFETNVYSEKITVKTPKLRIIERHNLGGVPAYYLYKDLPFLSVKELLSPSGAFLLFSSTFFVALMILTKTSLFDLAKGARFLIKSCYRQCKRALFSVRKPQRKKAPAKKPATKVAAKKAPAKFLSNPFAKRRKPTATPVETVSPLPSSLPYRYEIPSSLFLSDPKPIDQSSLTKDLQKQAKVLEKTLQNFHIEGKVGDIHCGPTITSFEVEPPVGVKVQKIKALENDIALSMEAKSVRILAPIPGKAVVGIEIPSSIPQEVSFKEMLDHYKSEKKTYHIPIMLGKTVVGEYVSADLTKTPHCLIAGATGSGKSVCINTLVMSILMNARPDQVKMLMIDPKKVELSQYSTLPHMIAPVISEPHGAYAALQWLVQEMQLRYEILKQLKLRNIHAFNKRKKQPEQESSFPVPIPEHMPFIVGIIDEFADLMMVSSSDLETPIARIAQMARAVGIHLILATQRPSREVITGIIKANFPTRIAFKVSNRVNSQIILDETGAESLLGNGDLLFNPPGTSNLVRAQGAYISDQDIYNVIEQITRQAPTNYLIESFDAMKKEEVDQQSGSDALYEKALEVVLSSKSASTTFLQRKLKIGYARAASLMDSLEENGVVGPQEGAKPRKVLKSHESYLIP